MKRLFLYILPLIALLSLSYGCSLKKNTWKTRKIQELNTRFNVFFNGKISYEEGLANIAKVNQDDYSNIIPMYPISRHSNAQAGNSNMDRTIEKCRKAIKQRSIKQKPEKNLKKTKDPDYQLWYKQEEFNSALKDAWLLLGKAEFHKADFLGAMSTFTYIMRHYETDKDAVAQCELWIVRSYAELSWIYEAEQMLGKVKQENLNWKNTGLYAAVNADLLLKKKQYKEAIPFLEIALKRETNKTNKLRFGFLLGQLYMKTDNRALALNQFKQLIKQNPPFDMELNARINMTSLDPNVAQVRKSLLKMAKDQKNKEYFDQVYFAVGKTYLVQKDTVRAIENFKKSIELSTRKGIDNAVTLVTLGDLYYNQQKYILAQPCYDQAAKIFPADYDDYQRISKRSETLGELVSQYEIVQLQDSLQTLANMPEKQRLEAVNKVIDKLIADEKAALEAAAIPNDQNNEDPEEALIGPPVGGNNMGNWYFYNPVLMKSGLTDFQRRWGKRKLEDNWRRTNKAASLFSEENNTQQAVTTNTETEPNSEPQAPKNAGDDTKSPEFYLKQIPLTPTQLQKSNEDLATALFNMGMIYKDKVEDYPMAIKTFNEYLDKFPTKESGDEACFQLYLLNIRTGQNAEAEQNRQTLIKNYPDSKYAKLMSGPDFLDKQKQMYAEQDSLYNLTYTAFNQNKFNIVKENCAYIQKNYPSSELLPKFLFLKVLAIGKTDKKEVFEKELSDLIDKYPQSDVSSMSKDILALLRQGMENKTGTTQGTLLAKREETAKTNSDAEIKEVKFSEDKQSKHRILFVMPADTKELNTLLYNVAVYNFTRFIMKDFDIVSQNIDSSRIALSVNGFETFDEAVWYLNSIQSDENMSMLLKKATSRKIIISEENYALLKTNFGLDDYLAFYKKFEPAFVPVKTDTKSVATKNAEQPAQMATNKSTEVAKTESTTNTVQDHPQPTVAPVQEPNVPLYKNLFAYKPNDPHYVAIAINAGNLDFEKTKKVIDTYNAANYSVLNLKVMMQSVGQQQIIIIGSFADANICKSYLFRMVNEQSVSDALKGINFRNLLGTRENLNVMINKNAMSTYMEFMQQYYLKP